MHLLRTFNTFCQTALQKAYTNFHAPRWVPAPLFPSSLPLTGGLSLIAISAKGGFCKSPAFLCGCILFDPLCRSQESLYWPRPREGFQAALGCTDWFRKQFCRKDKAKGCIHLGDLLALDHEKGLRGGQNSFSRSAWDILGRGDSFSDCLHLPLLQILSLLASGLPGQGPFAFVGAAY